MSISHDVNKGNIHVWHAYLSFYVGKLESTDCHQFLFRNLRGKLHFLYLCIYALTTLFFFFYTKSNLRRSKTQEAPCLNINITSYKQMRKITVPAYVWNKHLYIQLVNIYHYLHLILVFWTEVWMHQCCWRSKHIFCHELYRQILQHSRPGMFSLNSHFIKWSF